MVHAPIRSILRREHERREHDACRPQPAAQAKRQPSGRPPQAAKRKQPHQPGEQHRQASGQWNGRSNREVHVDRPSQAAEAGTDGFVSELAGHRQESQRQEGVRGRAVELSEQELECVVAAGIARVADPPQIAGQERRTRPALCDEQRAVGRRRQISEGHVDEQVVRGRGGSRGWPGRSREGRTQAADRGMRCRAGSSTDSCGAATRAGR
jgi:hypothetical protein